MKKLITLLLLSCSLCSFAQQKTKGYQNYTSYCQFIGSEGDPKTFIHSIQMEHNYLMNPNFAFGLSTGIEWMDIKMATLGPNIKLILPKINNQSLYLGASVGKAFALDDEKIEYIKIEDTYGSGFVNCELGYVFPSKVNFSIYVATGYHHQEYAYKIEDWWRNTVKRSITYNRFMFKIGARLF